MSSKKRPNAGQKTVSVNDAAQSSTIPNTTPTPSTNSSPIIPSGIATNAGVPNAPKSILPQMLSLNQIRIAFYEAGAFLVDGFLKPIQLFAAALATLFFFLAYKTTNTALQGTFASVSASFVFALVQAQITNFSTRLSKYRFRKLFGTDATINEMRFVYPDFVMSDEAQAKLKDAQVNPQLIYQKKDKVFAIDYRVDISRIIADNDVKALVYVAGLFGKVCRTTPSIVVDSSVVHDPTFSFLSFGLSSNDCTHLYVDKAKSTALFAIVPDGNGSEYLLVNNQKYETIKGADYYGIIVRYRPDPVDEPDRVWMFCAGLGERGTTGAAWFLANKWKALQSKVGDSDFCAVIKTPHYSDIFLE